MNSVDKLGGLSLAFRSRLNLCMGWMMFVLFRFGWAEGSTWIVTDGRVCIIFK